MDVSAPAPVEGFVVELERFQGPLDLLLHLIREQDIDIFDIPISEITQQFLGAIAGVERLGLDVAGEFLEMAATLVRIKVQFLLPRRGGADDELEDPRAELVRRLLEYEHFREAARRLEDAEADRVRHFGRGYVPARPEPEPQEVELELEVDDLLAAALALADRTRTPAEHRIALAAVPLEEKLTLIVDTLSRLERVEFQDLVARFGDRRHTVVTLMAGLELARRRRLELRQGEPFSPLWLLRRAWTEADEAPPLGDAGTEPAA